MNETYRKEEEKTDGERMKEIETKKAVVLKKEVRK
jgi:hypothetical protein